jgi:hypothetical protein
MIIGPQLPDRVVELRQYLVKVLSTLSNFLAYEPDSYLKYRPSYDNMLGNAT